MSGKVHLATGGPVGAACGAGARWLSSNITSTRGTRLVTCRSCMRTEAWTRACDLTALALVMEPDKV